MKSTATTRIHTMGGGEPLVGEEEKGNRFVLDILTYFFFFHVP